MNEKEAKLEGFYESYDVFLDVIKRLRTSLNDYYTIEYQDFLPNDGQDKTVFALKTLTFLEELFLDAYEEKVRPLQWEQEAENDLG
jgi:hypothetical protein